MATAERIDETPATRSLPDYFIRFTVGQRAEHAVLMVSFVVLAVTGLAQRFSDAGWGSWVILNLGGIENVRLVHRAFGFLFTASALYHFGYVSYNTFVKHAMAPMLPTLKDACDVLAVLRYDFGFADQKPLFGRYDYRQKFEYWGIVFGGIVMILTGFVLMYPVSFTRGLPGQFIAAAKEFHRNEAMLAALTIVVWHLYDTIFKPGIFPVDASIFTGKISRKRLEEEHTLEYDELMSRRTDTEKVISSVEETQEKPSEQ